MLSISLLARRADGIVPYLDFECYSDPARLLLSSRSWLGVAYAGINKQAWTRRQRPPRVNETRVHSMYPTREITL